MPPVGASNTSQTQHHRQAFPPLAANPDDQKQLAVVIDYYHDILKQSPEALDYL